LIEKGSTQRELNRAKNAVESSGALAQRMGVKYLGRNRANNRKIRNHRRWEEKIGIKNELGITDLTPYNAIRVIRGEIEAEESSYYEGIGSVIKIG